MRNEVLEKDKIISAHKEGISTFIGDASSVRILKRHGYNAVIIKSSKDAIAKAIIEAKNIADVRRKEQEKAELIGAEHIIAGRAVNEDVAHRCYATIKACEDSAKAMGVDMRGGNPTPGNIEGDLSSIEEKSLGCVYKGGTRPLQDAIGWAEKITKKGLIYMDTPGNDIEQLTGMVAGGCHICVFTTGRGTHRFSDSPTIKIASNTPMYEKMQDNMDINSGTIITGEEIIQQVGQRIFDEMLEVASGKLAKAEVLGHNDFGIWRIGPTM